MVEVARLPARGRARPGQLPRAANPSANAAPALDVDPTVAPELPCPHPYFSEDAQGLAVMGQFLALGLFVLAPIVWLIARWWVPAAVVMAFGALTLLASRAAFRWGDEHAMRGTFGPDDWARLQRELQAHEADLTRYARDHAGLTTPELVKGYLATHPRWPAFQLSDPSIAPLHFKISDWRDTIPRVVVGFGCDNNVVFNSSTMAVEQID